MAGRLILGGSGQSWGRKRITLGPDSRRLTSLRLLPIKMFWGPQSLFLLSPQRIEGLSRERRYNAVIKPPFPPGRLDNERRLLFMESLLYARVQVLSDKTANTNCTEPHFTE